MKKSGPLAVLVSALLVGGCSSDTDIPIDTALANKIDAMQDCFPDLYKKLDALLDIASQWNQKASNPPNPTGLTSTANGNQLDVVFALPGTSCVLNMTIKFYDKDGNQDSPDLSGSTLSVQLDNAATDMRNRLGATKPFMVGEWQATGTTASSQTLTGSGSFTGRIGGVTNANELAVIRTTTATPAAGEPPNADGTIKLEAAGGVVCELTFNTDDLQTDTEAAQQFPVGVITLTVRGANTTNLTGKDVTVNSTITFDNTNIAVVRVDGLTGRFEMNLTTFDFDFKG